MRWKYSKSTSCFSSRKATSAGELRRTALSSIGYSPNSVGKYLFVLVVCFFGIILLQRISYLNPRETLYVLFVSSPNAFRKTKPQNRKVGFVRRFFRTSHHSTIEHHLPSQAHKAQRHSCNADPKPYRTVAPRGYSP